MDVRQFAFLARQPSAALKSRSNFLELPKRGLALVLANAMFWQPLLAQADGIVVSASGTSLGQAANGVPIVNIAAPNASGLSHNQFKDYNVGANGLILNNATNRTESTQLGGIILGNSNLNGRAASTILNEVNGGSPSQLRGYTEVAGQSAHVIVANPYGITCNGCGFINTPQATLTTGKAVIENGQVGRYQVDQGSVSIEGAGINVNNIDRFEIITRSAKINAEIQAKNLTIIAGANDVDAKTLKTTARAADPATAPQLAIDSSALGGMYAGAIKLVSSEAGVGVKLDGKMLASGGDMQLDANGHLSLVETSATGAVNVKAQSLEAKGPVYAGTTLDMKTQGDLTSQNNLVAQDRITLAAGGQLTNNGIIEAGVNPDNTRNTNADISISAQSLNNAGKHIIASRDLDITATQTLNNQGGTLNGQRQTTVTAGTLDNQNKGRVFSAAQLKLAADTVLNGQGGLINSVGPLTATIGHLNNTGGEVSSKGDTTLTLGTMDNLTGVVMAENALTVTATGALNNQTGLISGWQGLTVNGSSLDNRNNGTVSSRQGDVSLTLSGALLNSHAGAVVSQKALTVQADSLDNSDQGVLSSAAGQRLTVNGLLSNTLDGSITSGAELTLQAMALNNSGMVNAADGLTFTGTDFDNSHGTFSGKSGVTLDLLGTLTNISGKLSSVGPLRVQRSAQINNQNGEINSQGLLSLLTGGLDNSQKGTIGADDMLLVNASGALDNSVGGLIGSRAGDLRIDAARLSNGKGALQGKRAVNLTVTGDIDNQSGTVIAQDGDLTVKAADLDNRGGTLSSVKGALETHLAGVLKNGYDLSNNSQGGTLQAQRLMLNALAGINNNGGRIAALAGDAVLDVGPLGNIDNRNGGIAAGNLLQVTGNHLDNSGDQGGKISGNQISFDLQGKLNNRKGIIESGSTLSTAAASLDNQNGQLRALGKSSKTVFAIGGLLDNSNGTLETANTDLGLNAGSFQNQGGNVLHVGTGIFGISMANLNDVGGQLVTHGNLTLDGDSWTNSSSLQANHLTVNVNQLTQTATGQLLSTAGLDGRGINWTNDGQIGTDGSATLDLSGSYGGKGRLSSAGALDLHAALINLEAAGSIAGGGSSTVTVDGLLNNYGRVTSAADMTVNAAGISNYGTLGGAQKLTVTTAELINDHGLIFSGADMGLRVDSLNNLGASVYSLGNLSIDRDGQGALASSIVNSSGSIQSDGSMSLAASTIQNVRTVLTTSNQGIYTASIGEIQCIEGYNAGDCSGKRNHVWQIIQRDKFEVTQASAASSITAGTNLAIRGGDLLNSSSTIAAGGALSATVTNLVNSGIETGETETSRTFMSERTNNAGGLYASAASFNNYYSVQGAGYNPNNLGGLLGAMSGFIGLTESELGQFRTTRKIAASDQTYAAVIQAGGAVSVNTQNGITSSVVRPSYTYVGAGPRTDNLAPANTFSTRVTVNQQLPPDLAHQQVNPVSLPGFSLPVGENGLFRLSGQTSTSHQSSVHVPGLPDTSVRSNPQKYLIETNPALTDLKQFMSSDYLLSKLGYNPDESAKRLGDGFYEQKLIQQAVTARTGQRFIDGQTSDDGMFKFLMNNAVASKDALNLQLGVSLTSEQVAALTHDIVWMENATVNGEQVLVPVLYMANANNRLAANGALIQGSDVTLIAGKELNNAGTLRASNNLSTTAGSDLVNSGLLEANNRLTALAGNNLTNKAGGIIAGRDVSITATGDVINERTITTHESSTGYKSEQRGFADNAARIEASNNLEVSAGRDISNRGGVLKSAQDTTLKASRDVNITSAEQVDSNTRGDSHNDRTVTQNGSSVTAGRDLVIGAGRDLTAVASQIDAKRDASLSAVDDLVLSSAADEQHSYGRTKKVTSQEDHTQQVATRVSAGGNVVLTAGNDLGLTASNVSAGNEAYLSAGANLTLQTAANEDYSFYSKVKKSSSGKKSRLDEVASTTNMASSVTSGTNSTLVAGKDLLIKGSEVAADKGAAKLVAGNDVQVVAVTDSNSARHESSKSKSSWGGLKSSKVQDAVAETQTVARGSIISGNTVDVAALHDVMVRGSGLVSTQDLNVRAGRDLVIDAAQNTFTHDEMHKQKNRDLTGVLTANNLGVDDITGNQHLSISSQNHTGRSTQTTLTGSTIGSSQGNVALTAGRELSVIASDLVSTKNMSLTGANVNIAAGMESASQSSTDKSSSLAVGRVVGGAVVDTFNSIRGAIQAANNADDPKLKAVKMAQAALAAYNLNGMGDSVSGSIKDYANNKGSSSSNGSLIKIGTETALTHSKSTSDYASQTAKQSSLNVGQALSIEATGKAPSTLGDIHVIGSSLKAADTALTAKNNIILESAQNTAGWANNNSNNRTAIGASFNIGQQNGFTIDLGAQIAKGMGTGSSVTQVNTTLNSGVLTLHSGKDTTLDGAQVRATKIDALVEGNLNITSRQDSETEKNKQGSAGVGASICIPPICYGAPVTASASLSAGNMKSNYQAVTEQSGLFAGNGGYNIVVGANTTLKGAVIASDATADKNLLSTDRLITSDIKNKSEIKSTSASVSGSASYGGSGGSAAALGGLFGMSLNESDSSKTRSAVSEGTIIVRNAEGANDLIGLNRDTANANEKLDRPDKKAMEERMELIRSSVELVNGISDAIATAKMKAAQDSNSDESKAARQQLLEKGNANPTPDQIAQQVSQNYGVGSSFKKAAQAVSAVVQGVLGGNIAGALAGAAAPYVAEKIKQATGDDDAANLMAHAVWGAVLAKAQGNSALAGAAGAGIGEYIAKQLYPNTPRDQLTESEKQTISALSTLAGGLAGGLAAGGLDNAIAAAGTAKNAVENNQLSVIDGLSLEKMRLEYNASCAGVTSTECAQLGADIEALFKKAQSILKEEPLSLASDATWDSKQEHKPGDIVMCKTSFTSFCVVTDQFVKTADGVEWYLKPATVDQALEGRANQEKLTADMKASLQKVAADSFSEGCGGMGLIGIGCQLSMGFGTTNPITDTKATTGERIAFFAQALLNIVGLKAAVGSAGVKDTLAGAGGNWNVLDEAFSPNVVKQTTPTACGAACGEMLLKDRGVLASQIDLGTELTSMNSLANKLNGVSSGWVGNAVDTSSFYALNKTGSWSAMMWDSGSRVGHWVVVNGVDDAGRVIVRDPFNGTQYKMDVDKFKEVWNGHSVYKQ